MLSEWLELNAEESELKRRLKEAEADLDAKAYTSYPKLTEAEVKTLAVDDKWMAALGAMVHDEMDRVEVSRSPSDRQGAWPNADTRRPRCRNRKVELLHSRRKCANTWNGWALHGRSGRVQPR